MFRVCYIIKFCVTFIKPVGRRLSEPDPRGLFIILGKFFRLFKLRKIFSQLEKCTHLNSHLGRSCDLAYLHQLKFTFFSVVEFFFFFFFFLAQPNVKVVNFGKSFVMKCESCYQIYFTDVSLLIPVANKTLAFYFYRWSKKSCVLRLNNAFAFLISSVLKCYNPFGI